MLFCRGKILFTIYAYKGGRGGEPKDDRMTRGGEGVWIPPKSDDVIYEQPLIRSLKRDPMLQISTLMF